MHEKQYWNQRYANGGNSGYGSYDQQLDKKLNWLSTLDFETVTEVGCGDLNFATTLLRLHPAKYIGYDISDVIINKNKILHPELDLRHFEYQAEPADLVLCVDVLFHIIDDADVERILQTLESAWTKYLVVTAYERDEKFDNHVRIRKFDYSRFGRPIVREIVEEDGSLYFYIFKK